MSEFITFFITIIGYDSHTIEARSTKRWVFALTFFNSSIVILLMGANMDKIPILDQRLFTGRFRDFTDQWYVLIGSQIVLNSVGDLVSPFIDYLVNHVILNIQMCCD